ncbi:hypothetical protein niasHT_012874 [Heterodera trifolii]|uniref:Uncharacterized protein n=1 Tax=Heterodera trifolii TaxID=157864 RepID=A0ABD2KYQ8_9BILA
MSIFALIFFFLFINTFIEPVSMAMKKSSKSCKVGVGNLTDENGNVVMKGRFKMCPKGFKKCAKNEAFGTTAFCVELLE